MKNTSIRIYAILTLAIAGAIFSGYLSAVKLFSAACALTVPCPLFLGQPACYFGFAMFVALAVLAFLWALGCELRAWVVGLSACGACFALYFTALEWGALMALASHFSWLAVPSCAVGLMVYLAVLWLSLRQAPSAR
jgi:hypothetical protein